MLQYLTLNAYLYKQGLKCLFFLSILLGQMFYNRWTERVKFGWLCNCYTMCGGRGCSTQSFLLQVLYLEIRQERDARI